MMVYQDHLGLIMDYLFGSSNLEDAIGQFWILPFGLDADDSKLDDMFDATVGGYQ